MFEWLIAPLHYAFMVRGIIAAMAVGILCSAVGTFVVLRGMTFIGDALAHAILPGLAVGFLTAGKGDRDSLFWWAMGTAILTALGMGWISSRTRFREDAAIGIVFAGMFALGIALISTVRGFSVDLVHFLFGNVLGVSTHDLVLIAAFGGGVLLILSLFYKELVIVSFDITLARTLRIRAGFYRYLLFVLIAITVVLSLQTVGIGLMLTAGSFIWDHRLVPILLLGCGVWSSHRLGFHCLLPYRARLCQPTHRNEQIAPRLIPFCISPTETPLMIHRPFTSEEYNKVA